MNVHRGNIIVDDNNHTSDRNAIPNSRVFSQSPEECFTLSNSGRHEVSLEFPWALVTHIRVLTTAAEASEYNYQTRNLRRSDLSLYLDSNSYELIR